MSRRIRHPKIPVKTSAEIEKMRTAGRLTAQVLRETAERIKAGIATRELDDFAAKRIRELGGVGAFYGYHGYPGHLCVSVNEEIVHGIPGPRVIRDGDIVSIDVGIVYDGFIGDCAMTVPVGEIDPEVERLLRTTRRALDEAIRFAVHGKRLGDVSAAVQRIAEEAGFSVVRKFVGHGIGREMHEEPQIPNFGRPGTGPVLQEGMTLAIEPMVNMGGFKARVLEDDWTAVTADGKPSAHFEYTVAVGREKAEVLTPWDDE